MAILVELFGRPAIDAGGERVALAFERRHQLLAYLAARGAWVGRAELATLLWPQLPAKLAHANLRKTLFRIQSLPWAAAIESQGNALRYEGTSDAAAFEKALGEQRLADALAFDATQFLAGFDDASSEPWTTWLGFERNRLAGAWRAAALQFLDGDVAAPQAIALGARMLAADPADEEALRAHVRWLVKAGQAAAARQACRDFTERLERDFGVQPSAELKALHDSLLAGAPPPPTAPVALHVRDDGFVGRALELQAIADCLSQAPGRLVTLVGPGGAGKTRLARRALQDQAVRFEQGAAFVALEEVRSPAAMAESLVRQLDVGATSADASAQLVAYLRERHMLLVLDNFEQLAAGAQLLSDLLAACPRLHLLVTSRVRLGLPGEALVPVHGLPCPDAEDRDRLEAFDAVRLFIRAARRGDPGFAPTEVASIVEICRHVGGLPLALELAAAWTRLLSCEAIAAELREGTELLRASDATHPARHASLEIVFEQSWALLGAAEQEALARLAVFRGGCTADAARAVTGVSLAVLAALVDKSLLRKDGRRLLLHPVVNQLAALKLDAEARAQAEAAHMRFYQAMLAQLQRPTELGDRAALSLLDEDYDNWVQAWRTAARLGQLLPLVSATPTLRMYSDHRGRTREVCALFEQALAANPEPAEPRFEPVLLGALAHCQQRLDRFAESMASAHRALRASRRANDPEARLRCLNTLGACNMRLARNTEARRYYRMALKLAEGVPNPRFHAVLMQNLAQIEKRQDKPAEALRLLLRALDQFRAIGDHASEALCLYQLGSMQCDQGDVATGVQSLRAALALCDSHGLHRTRGYVLTGLADAALELRDTDSARVYAKQGLELSRQAGARMLESWMLLHHARIAMRGNDLAAARNELRAAVEITLEVGSPVGQVPAMICFGELLATQGEKDCASRVLEFARSQGSASLQDRKQVDAIRTEWQLPSTAGWPGLSLEELGRRVAGEAPLAHASLIATLRESTAR